MIMSNEKQVWTLPDPANDPSLFINDVEFINKQRIVDVLNRSISEWNVRDCWFRGEGDELDIVDVVEGIAEKLNINL